jgi:hypothetical protein
VAALTQAGEGNAVTAENGERMPAEVTSGRILRFALAGAATLVAITIGAIVASVVPIKLPAEPPPQIAGPSASAVPIPASVSPAPRGASADQADREQRAYNTARGNTAALRALVESCSVCAYATAARSEIVKLEAADREEHTYNSARGNKFALQAYLNSCIICTYEAAAHGEISRLEAAEQEERAYSAARGNLTALRIYLSTCQVCSNDAAARAEIHRLELAAWSPPAPSPATGTNCGGNGDPQILRPLNLLYQAVNQRDIAMYAEQWAEDAVYRDVFTGGKPKNREEKIKTKQKQFVEWTGVDITMDRSPQILSRSAERAEIEVYYTIRIKPSSQTCLIRSNIQERYTVVCNGTGRWQVLNNTDEINVSGPPGRC